MKVKNTVFINGTWEALAEFGKKELPFKLGYDVSRTIRKMKDGADVFGEARNKIITKFGKKDEKTGNISIDPKDKVAMDNFNKEIKKLVEIEEEYDVKKITVDSKIMEGKDVKPNLLILLEDFIEVK